MNNIAPLKKHFRHKSNAIVEKIKKNDRLKESMENARSFAVLLALIFIFIKVVLFFSDSSIALRTWEWIPMWPAMSYQHVIVALLCFALFTGLFFIGRRNRKLGIVATSLAGIIQFVLPFLHMSSFRVQQIVGGYATFEMIQADSEGTIFLSALTDPSNLPYTIPGILSSIAAVSLPLLFRKKAIQLLSFLTAKRAAVVFSAWIILGVVSANVVSSNIGVVASDPIVFYYVDMIEKKISLLDSDTPNSDVNPNIFPTKQIHGNNKVIQTASLFSNVEQWRKTKQNVVLVIMESMPAAQASFMGAVRHGKKKTRDTLPNLKSMTDNMMLWNNHYTVHPTSMSSLFSIACSMYPYPAGGNITSINPRIPCKSMSEIFAEKGYRTALFHSGRFSFWKKTKFFKERGYSKMYDAKNMPGKGIEKSKWGIDELAAAKAISRYIKKHRKESFFIQYITVFPHAPYKYKDGPWAIYPSKKPIDKYHNSLRYEDAAIKIVTDTVKRLGLEKDTLFIFVGDHGEAFHEHSGNEVHSKFVYQENVHVAFGMHNPILFPTHRSTDRVTSHIDILPTLADLIEIDYTAFPWQGKSVFKNAPSPLVYFFTNWSSKFVGVRDGRYKAIWNRNKKKIEIYDLKRDKEEKTNLAKKYPTRKKGYVRAVNKWWNYQKQLIRTFGKE